jgi:hypothetical protein
MMRRLVGDQACERILWLDDAVPTPAGGTGYDVESWADSVWVLHAMFEREGADSDVTYHQARQADIAAGRDEPLVVNGVNFEQGTVDTGVPLGFVRTPAPPWRRLRWAELAAREGFALGADMAWPPSFQWFPFESWPLRMLPPPEGSLDESTLNALIRVLAEHSHADAVKDCGAFFCPAAMLDVDALMFFAGDLQDVPELVAELGMTPSNLWPADKSWFLYTDWDLMASRVSGSRELIAAIEIDDELETLRWTHPASRPEDAE